MPALPKLGGDNEFFWTSGVDGVLRFLRCKECSYFIHPPQPRCPKCHSTNVEPDAVSGEGVVESFTFITEGNDDPFVAAWISFPEQNDFRLTSKVVGITPAEAKIGITVRVEFEHHEDVYLPVFRPSVIRDG